MSIRLSAASANGPVHLESILFKPEKSDIQFRVTCEGEQPKLFHAHKLVLVVASEVFDTMFYGSVPQQSPVDIEDSASSTFEAFLRLIYTGTTRINDADAAMRYVESSITAKNVGEIVLHGQNFLEDAPQKFWENVESHGEVLLKSQEFLLLQKNSVRAVFRRNLDAEEMLLYAQAVAWARAECTRNDLPTDGETLRNAVDGIVQLVRFSTMDAEKFARGPGSESVLTAEEKVEVFKWHNAAIPQSIFPSEPRYVGMSYVCARFGNRTTGWSGDGRTQAVDFTVDRTVCVTGYGVYGPYSDGLKSYTISAKLLLGSVALTKKDTTDAAHQAEEIIKVDFDKPVKLETNKRYTASVTVSGISHYYGTSGCSSKTIATKKGNVVFSFTTSSTSVNTNVTYGQIPQIMFRI